MMQNSTQLLSNETPCFNGKATINNTIWPKKKITAPSLTLLQTHSQKKKKKNFYKPVGFSVGLYRQPKNKATHLDCKPAIEIRIQLQIKLLNPCMVSKHPVVEITVI
jgi:hypothetical protein